MHTKKSKVLNVREKELTDHIRRMKVLTNYDYTCVRAAWEQQLQNMRMK